MGVLSWWLVSALVDCVPLRKRYEVPRPEPVRIGFVFGVASVCWWSPWPPVCAQKCSQQPAGNAALVCCVNKGSPLGNAVKGQAVSLLVSPTGCGRQLLEDLLCFGPEASPCLDRKRRDIASACKWVS